jgi:hypothetical protein
MQQLIWFIRSLLLRVFAVVSAWDLIQCFLALSFFGWLAFARLNDAELREISSEKLEWAWRNLHVTNGYFFISFVFFIIAAAADYLLHHPTIFGSGGLVSYLIILVATAFLFGLIMLVSPMLIVHGIGTRGRDLGDIDPPPVKITAFAAYCAAGNTFMLVPLIYHFSTLLTGGQLVLVEATVSYLSPYLVLKSWGHRDIRLYVLGWVLALLAPVTGTLLIFVFGLHLY